MKEIQRFRGITITSKLRAKLTLWSILCGIWLYLPATTQAQAPDPVQSIQQLREGYLVIRMPSYRAKIDTLLAMAERSSDANQRLKLENAAQEAMAERDEQFEEYRYALETRYTFSKCGYIYDYESHDLHQMPLKNLDGTPMATEGVKPEQIFFLHFDRGDDSKVEALVIVNHLRKPIPSPFPNQFSLGGLNYFWSGLMGKDFALWRIEKMNKLLFRYWEEIRM